MDLRKLLIPLTLLVLVLGLLLWVATWDLDPKVKPQIFPTPALRVTNNAWVGYWVEPFEITIKSGGQLMFTLNSDTRSFVKARQTTSIPLARKRGELKGLSFGDLTNFRVESEVTATRWGLRKTIVVNRSMSLAEILGEAVRAF